MNLIIEQQRQHVFTVKDLATEGKAIFRTGYNFDQLVGYLAGYYNEESPEDRVFELNEQTDKDSTIIDALEEEVEKLKERNHQLKSGITDAINTLEQAYGE